MHIAINGWFLGQETAGSGQYLHHLLREMAGQANNVRFSLLLPEDWKLAIGDWGIGADNLTVQELSSGPFATASRLGKVWWEQIGVPRAARRLEADVLWVPYWAAPLWQPVPTVVTVHDLIPRLLPEYRGGLLQRLYTALVSQTARRADAVIAVSEASARDVVAHLGAPPSRVHAVLSGPNQPPAAPDASTLAEVRRRYRLPDRYFLYLGGFDVRKNLRTTLAAHRRYLDLALARGVQPLPLVIAGKLPATDSPFAPEPRHLAAELGLAEHVHFCGWVDEVDKTAIYALATAFIFPSVYEGFGMMILEAMQAGTPVITSAGG